MAFGIVGIIACLCCKDVDYKMTNKVWTWAHSASYDFAGLIGDFRSKSTSRTPLSPTGTSTINALISNYCVKGWHIGFLLVMGGRVVKTLSIYLIFTYNGLIPTE